MSAIKGDFTGFTFNGVHSSELGLTRVSDGSRYSENLFPAIQDKTVQVPGADGTYYFGSYYTQQPFNLSVVYDDMTEEQFQKIKRVFGDKKIHDLIFDEAPYKVYRVKTTGTPNLKYICFDKGIDEFDRDYQNEKKYETKEQLYGIGARSPFGRIYKGEGQINFICYTPVARSRYKYLDQYTMQNVPEWGSMDTASADDVHYNLYDWADASGLKISTASKSVDIGGAQKTYQIDVVEDDGVLVYNPGNFSVHFSLSYIFTTDPEGLSSGKDKNGDNYYYWDFNGRIIGQNNTEMYLRIKPFSQKRSDDEGFRINGKLNLIEGIKWDSEKQKYVPTGSIYNEYIDAGDFFKIPILFEMTRIPISKVDLNDTESSITSQFIEYDYLYY